MEVAMHDMRDMRVLKSIGNDGKDGFDLVGGMTFTCDKLIEDGATLDVFDHVVAMFLLLVCVRVDAKIHDLGNVAMLDLFELFGVGKKSLFSFARSQRRTEELDDNVFFLLALFLFPQESAAAGPLAEQPDDSIWPNVLWCCLSHVAVPSSPEL